MRPNTYRRDINCDFFRVSSGSLSFSQLLDRIDERCPSISEKNMDADNGRYRIFGRSRATGATACSLMRLRVDEPVLIGSDDQDEFRDVELQPGESLAQCFAFCHFEEFNILVMHRNRDVGSRGRLVQYINQKASVTMDLEVVLNVDAMETFRSMKEFTFAEFKVAVPDNFNPLVSPADSVKRASQAAVMLAHDVGGATVEFKISMGHSRQSLNRTRIQRLYSALLSDGQEAGAVERARVRGRLEDGDEIRTVDLIEDKMREKVALRAENGGFPSTAYYESIARAYSNRRHELRQLFGK